MIQQLTSDFLRKYSPYNLLTEAELTLAAQSAILDFYPNDTRIYTQENSKTEYLYVIQKGVCV